MNCKQAKEKLALLIGNDLDASAVGEIQQHLGQCAGCREHLQRLSSCLEVLQVPAAGAFHAEGESLWPRISVRLASPSAGQKPHRLSGWGPTLAVAAACTAMFWVASYQFGGNGADRFSVPSPPIPLQQIGEVRHFQTTRAGDDFDIRVEVHDGVLRMIVPRERATVSAPDIFILWMVSSSLVLMAVAILFLRGQVRPIERLARAADASALSTFTITPMRGGVPARVASNRFFTSSAASGLSIKFM